LAWAKDRNTSPANPGGNDAAGNSSDDTWEEASPLMVVADFNLDGVADIAKATYLAGDPSGSSVLTVSLGKKDGTFQQTSYKALGYKLSAMVAFDSNRDGIPDLIVGTDDGSLISFLGDGKGNLAFVGFIAHLDSVVSIVVDDFNRDGVSDLAVTDWRSSSVALLLGAADGTTKSTRTM
jgi:hypothetical protein